MSDSLKGRLEREQVEGFVREGEARAAVFGRRPVFKNIRTLSEQEVEALKDKAGTVK